MNAACALGMDSFIATSINIFPELTINLVAAGKNGDILTARKMQERLSNAVIAISKHGKYNTISFYIISKTNDSTIDTIIYS